MQAVILCGGLGTRLKPIINDIPKPMAPIKEKPFLSYMVNILEKNGFDKLLFLTGFKAEIIENYFRNYNNLKIVYSKENEPLGTGGALFNAWDKLDDKFVLINGDTFFDVDYTILINFVHKNNVEAAIALKYSKDTERYGFVCIDENYEIQNFIEKNNLSGNQIDGYINSGIYFLRKNILNKIFKNWNDQILSIEKDIFPLLIKEKKLFGLPLEGMFIDIGIPEDYKKAQDKIPEWVQQDASLSLLS